MRRTFETRDGLKLAADALGDPAAPPVLLLHGGGQTRHAWGNTARVLAEEGFYAIALDARGHGDSDWSPTGDYALATFARDVVDVMLQLARPPALVGASLGGMSALIAEAELDGPCTPCLILVDITPRADAEGVLRIVSFMRANPEGFASLEEAADRVAEFLHHRPRPSDTSGLEKNLRLGADGRYRWHWDPEFLGGLRGPEGHDFSDRLVAAARALTVPTLLLRGRMSDVVKEANAREFLELVPHAEYVDVADAAHMVAGDRNDVFCMHVVAFLEKTLGRPADADRR